MYLSLLCSVLMPLANNNFCSVDVTSLKASKTTLMRLWNMGWEDSIVARWYARMKVVFVTWQEIAETEGYVDARVLRLQLVLVADCEHRLPKRESRSDYWELLEGKRHAANMERVHTSVDYSKDTSDSSGSEGSDYSAHTSSEDESYDTDKDASDDDAPITSPELDNICAETIPDELISESESDPEDKRAFLILLLFFLYFFRQCECIFFRQHVCIFAYFCM